MMNGSCLCGDVRYELKLDHINMYQCHCEQCRKQTGTASSCGTVVKEERFVWLTGEKNIGVWEKDSGFTSHFCRSCGSSVPNKFRGYPYYWIPVGTLDSANVVTVANLYSCEKARWSNVVSGVNSYETKPSIKSLVKLLVDTDSE